MNLVEENLEKQEIATVQDSPLGLGVVLNLSVFEGPMDLLIFLIEKDEIDIFDIPIALITREYLTALQAMHAHDLDVSGEFLVMAATLLKIKARMLVPRQAEQDEEFGDDPRHELVERILEYRAFKESAKLFQRWETGQSSRFWKGLPVDTGEAAGDIQLDVNLFDLIGAFQHAIARISAEKPRYAISMLEDNFDQRINCLRQRFKTGGKLTFSTLAEEIQSRLTIIITFLAILELIRSGEIKLQVISDKDFFMIPIL